MTVQINIPGLEPIAAAIDNLAQAISGQNIVTTFTDKTSSAPAPVSQPAAVQPPTPPVPLQAGTAPVAPPVTPAPVAVPTSMRAYTQDELAKAAMALMDSGRQGELLNLLRGFGVVTLPELPSAQYGAFATALRGMGAQI